MARNDKGTADFTSGFRPYPQQGFQIQPQQNYWEGGNFHVPGINAGAPLMTSSMMSNFPALSSILKMQSPPPMSPIGGTPFVGALPTQPSPTQPGRGPARQTKKWWGSSLLDEQGVPPWLRM